MIAMERQKLNAKTVVIIGVRHRCIENAVDAVQENDVRREQELQRNVKNLTRLRENDFN